MNGFSIVPNNYEGDRVVCDKVNGDGWFLLRLSLHEIILNLNIESDYPGGIELIFQKLNFFIKRYSDLDDSEVEAIL